MTARPAPSHAHFHMRDDSDCDHSCRVSVLCESTSVVRSGPSLALASSVPSSMSIALILE